MGENSPPAVDTSVLQTIGINAAAQRDSEEDDLALAKAMQEQERAFHSLATQAQQHAVHAAMSPRGEHQQRQQLHAQLSGENTDAGEENNSPRPPDATATAATLQEAVAGGDRGQHMAAALATMPEGLTDEEWALALQQEEQQAHLLELAGYDDAGGEAEGEYDEDEGGYMSDDSVEPDDMTYEELQALGEAVGCVSRGLPPGVAAGLPRKRYSAPRHASAQDEQCAVCREEYQGGEEVASLPCSHFYHPACIAQWLQHQKVCPICSHELKAGS